MKISKLKWCAFGGAILEVTTYTHKIRKNIASNKKVFVDLINVVQLVKAPIVSEIRGSNSLFHTIIVLKKKKKLLVN